MDPTTSVPVHFTLQTLSLAAAGLVLAWAIVRKRWVVALGAALLAGAEAVHAGHYLATDDEPALVALRFVGIALVLVVAFSVSGRRRLLLVAGSAGVVGGTAWGAVAGGGLADLTVGPHVLIAAGAATLGVWAWLASRESIRLRVLTALVGILAITIVVGGGAVSRAAALDKRNEGLRLLAGGASEMRLDVAGMSDDVAARALALSVVVEPGLSAPSAQLPGLGAQSRLVVVVDRQGRLRFSNFHDFSITNAQVRSSAAVRSALNGRSNTALDVISEGLVVVGASPVFRRGQPQTPSNVVGAAAAAAIRTPLELQRYLPDAEIAIVGRGATALSDATLEGIRPLTTGTQIATGRVQTRSGSASAAAVAIDDDVRLVVVGSDDGIVESASALLRALLLAILASAVLAVVVALWLSARVTRPILDLAQGAERVKSDFLSSVSHELRTPLTPIRGYTELLRRGRVPARRAATYLDEIGEAAERLERIVTLLLDVAAMEAGRFRIDRTDQRPDELLNDAAARWAPETRQDIQVKVARGLGRVHGDPDVLKRTLDELIDNAIKFSPDGGVIELRARRTGGGVEIAVTDEGIGMSEEQSRELTAAFAQLESGDRRRFGGLGLGLAYVSGVLLAHAGRLVVDTAPGRGTTFSFTLPTTSMVTRMPARAGDASSTGVPESPSR
jgi:signal transduction histidine kinase